MISTTDPGTMTAEERQREVVGILARGLLRRAHMARTAMSPARGIVSEGRRICLDVATPSCARGRGRTAFGW